MRRFCFLTDVLILTFFITFTIYSTPNFDEPITGPQVREAVETILRESSPELSIHRVTQGLPYKAEGSIGYYYVELRPHGFMIVPATKRYPIEDVRGVKIKVPYPDFFIKMESRLRRPVAYYGTLRVRLESFYDWLLRRTPQWGVNAPAESDRAWIEKILKNEGGILGDDL